MQDPAAGFDLIQSPPGSRLPTSLAVAGRAAMLRAQLVDLAAAIETRCPGLGVSIWLLGTGDRKHVIGDRPPAHLASPHCSTPLRSSSGALLGAIEVFSVSDPPAREDITRVEAAAWMAALLVESSRGSDYRWLLDRVPSVIYISEPGEHGAWRYVSAQIEPILGYSPDEWQRDPTLWASRLHPADRELALAGEVEGPSEYRMIHRDGHVVWIRDEARIFEDELGHSLWHGVLSDITEQKRAEAELERRAAQQAVVARLGEHALERAAIVELMQEAVVAAQELLEVDGAVVAELAPDGETFKVRAASGVPALTIGSDSLGDGFSAQGVHTVLTGTPVMVHDWRREERFDACATMTRRGIAASATVAIEGHDDPFGILGVHAASPREFSAGDLDFIQSLANVLADALERQTTEDAMQHRALHDPLTGLPNRVLFLDRLEHALERLRRQPRARVAVLFIDLDNFKLVNDSLGHHAGDELLTAAAARLRQAVRPSDTVARFGGDEFGLLLEEISNEREAIAMAERIAGVFARPFPLDASDHFVTTSIGIALAEGGELPHELIRDADAAMYRAKERGRARYELFDELMRGRAIARLRIENDLRRAIENDELRLAYQPIVALRDESVAGVEALIRWDHPDRGPIPPNEFIPVAEESGLIERIGRWVLDRACRHGAQWSTNRPDAAPIWIAVNLSPLQLAHFDCAAMVGEALRASGLDPALLHLELTETLLLGEVDQVAEILRALKALGARLVLDDFGTGYSSLGYLTRLQLDALKIDRAFVQALGGDSTDHAITEAIVAMAKALSLTVVGEGAETDAQVGELRRLGCDFAQGYAFSEPLTVAEVSAVLARGARLRALPGRRPARRGPVG